MRAMLYLPYVGMPNILAGEKLVPELLQDDASPAALAAALSFSALQDGQITG
jgi:lipid-A-disaccharide synthase